MRSPFVRWSQVLARLFPAARKPKQSNPARLEVEELVDRIVPSLAFSPNPNVADGKPNSLRSDIIAADKNPAHNATVTFNLKSGAIYELTIPNPNGEQETAGAAGDLNIYSSAKGTKTFIFNGLGKGATIEQTVLDRVFEISGSNVKVEFKNVTIIGGHAVDDGAAGASAGTTDALGGGVLNEGGTVEFINAKVEGNEATGASGAAGATGGSATANADAGDGGDGGDGASAYGGGFYSTSGTITIEGSLFSHNLARGGNGGAGGDGGNATEAAGTGNAGAGGTGGAGGDASGSAIYMATGTLLVEDGSHVVSNSAEAGSGGAGGRGGSDNESNQSGGAGGTGGEGGDTYGGGVYVATGTVTISGGSDVNSNLAQGGDGGTGASGGNDIKSGGHGGKGGDGGHGGDAYGGGVYLANGSLTITGGSSLNGNVAIGGHGGMGGYGGEGATGPAQSVSSGGGGNSPSNGGGMGLYGGFAAGGGVYVGTGSIAIDDGSTVNFNHAQGGDGGTGGTGGNSYSVGGAGGTGGTGGNASGGGVYLGNGSIALSQAAAVDNNSALAGAGGSGGIGGNATELTTGLAGNGGVGGDSGTASGGGIFAGGGAISVLGSSVDDNVAGGQGTAAAGGDGGNAGPSGSAGAGGNGGDGASAIGGGIALAGGGSITISQHSDITGNEAIGQDGGLGGHVGTGDGAATGGTTGTAGSARGGGIYASGTTKATAAVSLTTAQVNSNIDSGGNGALAQGGGVYVGVGKLTLDQAAIANNRVNGAAGLGGGDDGGGLYISSGASSLTIQASSITQNSAATGASGTPGGGAYDGGGIYAAASTTTITDSTIAFDQAHTDGGGLFIDPAANTTLDNDTIADNSAGEAGGGVYNDGALALTSTIVAGNTSPTASDMSDPYGVATAASCIVQDGSGNSVQGGVYGNQVGVASDQLALDSSLTPTANGTAYLGFSGATIASNAGSNPDNLATDQIGNARTDVNGNTGVGAIQLNSAYVPTSVTAVATKGGYVELINSNTGQVYQDFQPFGTKYAGVLSVALGDVNGDGVPDLIVATKSKDTGQVLVYDGAAAIEPGVDFSDPTTWTNGTASILPGGESSPLIDTITPFAGYKGGLNVAAGDVDGDGLADVIVGTVAGNTTRVAVYSSTDPSTPLGAFTPFGASFKGGATVAAGDVTGDGSVDVIVGSASQKDEVNVYSYTGSDFTSMATLTPFGRAAAGVQVAAIDPDGSGVDDIAVATLSGGTVQVAVVTGNGNTVGQYTVGKHLTAYAIGAVDPSETGAGELLFAGIAVKPNQVDLLDPTSGDEIGVLPGDLPTLKGGVSLAGC